MLVLFAACVAISARSLLRHALSMSVATRCQKNACSEISVTNVILNQMTEMKILSSPSKVL